MTVNAIRGFNDILEVETERWHLIEATARRIFSLYGFKEVRLPALEKTELFLRSIGETTDIVEKQMYTFTDNHGDSVTLRPEGTAGAVRAFIENKLYTAPSTRLYYTGPMFRYERPQKGRFRQFYQIGAELLGEASAKADAEVIAMLNSLFTSLSVKGLTIEINSLGCTECRPGFKTELQKFFNTCRDNLCENCQRRIDKNPLRALDCKSAKCIEATDDAPSILDSLCNDCGDHFGELKARLASFNVAYTINQRMVRGLDYYSKTAFEVTALASADGKGGVGSQNSIAAGGRYDSLVEELGGPKTPCFGFAIGLERLSLVLSDDAVCKKLTTTVIALGKDAEKASLPIIAELRNNGISVTMDYSYTMETPLKTRMKRANRLGADFVLILGEDELKDNILTFKDMQSGEQFKLSTAEAIEKIQRAASDDG
jgi:histidyl-tRNA synthetase